MAKKMKATCRSENSSLCLSVATHTTSRLLLKHRRERRLTKYYVYTVYVYREKVRERESSREIIILPWQCKKVNKEKSTDKRCTVMCNRHHELVRRLC